MGIAQGALPPLEPDVTAPSGKESDAALIGAGEMRQARAWGSLTGEQRELQATKMAIHAAMVDRMDQNIGKVLQALRTWESKKTPS